MHKTHPPGPWPGYRLALGATWLALLVVLLGAYTRLSHAGLGCPDWPGCYGFVGVPVSAEQQAVAGLRFPGAPVDATKARIEMLHRYLAGGLGLLVLAITLGAWRQGEQRGLTLTLALVVVIQALFGMWTVTLKLWPPVVTLHLLGGLLTLSLLFALSLRRSRRLPAARASPALRALAAVGLALAVAQIGLGGWVSANYAALACVDFPTCQGLWWPPMDLQGGFSMVQAPGPDYLGGALPGEARTAIHMLHRVGALVLALVLLALIGLLFRHGLTHSAALLLLLLAGQLSLGIANVLLQLPLVLAVAHNGGAALLLLTLVALNLALQRPTPQASAWGERRVLG